MNRRRERLVEPAWREAWASASCLGALAVGLLVLVGLAAVGVVLWRAGWL